MGRLRAGESLPAHEDPRPRFVVGRKKVASAAAAAAARKRTRASVSSESAVPPSPPAASAASASRVRPEGRDVTVEDPDALDCGICCLPLKPPIFQCNVGHVVCSPCRDKLKATGKCHLCGGATGGYRRCHAMERLVESIRIPCPNAGCTARVAYHEQEGHSQVCPRRPCHCPDEACDFIGSTEALLDHFSGIHGWPCTDEQTAEKGFTVHLHEGFNFVVADRYTNEGTNTYAQYLFLLNMARLPFGCTVSVLCIRPDIVDAAAGPSKEIKCELVYSRYIYSEGDQMVNHHQQSEFKVPCTDLSSGLPDLSKSFQFIVPRFVYGDEEDTLEVTVWLVIN
ncbi:hypothetical protein ACP70R_040884 [Stipagrostis hirtigluma subsp. patula]